MHPFLVSTFLVFSSLFLKAQSGETIIAELHAINKTIVNRSCSTSHTTAISNRAMNVFMADKTGYLSQNNDLSFYTNYVTFNTVEGTLTMKHNFQKTTGSDEPIKGLFNAGISIRPANDITAPFLDQKFENALGLLLSYKWLSKVKTHFRDCVQNEYTSNQKQSMDALRAALIQTLTVEINKKTADFESAVSTVDRTDLPGQHPDTAIAIMRRHFYESVKEEYAEKFARQQAEILTETRNYKNIAASWTSITSYIPVISPHYLVAASFTGAFQKRYSYPLEVILSHTQMWESTKWGRWFVTMNSKVFLNNSKKGSDLLKVDFDTYKSLGGTDTLPLRKSGNDKTYIGPYENFITPSITGRLVYFPPAGSHVGLSVMLEQYFGRYHLLNGKMGVPVVLINSKKVPAVNFEFYVLLFDMNHTLEAAKINGSKTVIGLNIGIPFSRLMY